jgi:hypothetical protein
VSAEDQPQRVILKQAAGTFPSFRPYHTLRLVCDTAALRGARTRQTAADVRDPIQALLRHKKLRVTMHGRLILLAAAIPFPEL